MKNTIKGIKFQTHIIRRQSLKVGLHCNRIPKAQVCPLDDKTILNGLVLEKKREA